MWQNCSLPTAVVVVWTANGQASISISAISTFQTQRLADVDRGQRLARGILVHRSLLSTSHFARQTSPAWSPRSTTTLTLPQLVNVSGCTQACCRGRRGRGQESETHERLVRCGDGGWRWPSEDNVHIMLCLETKKRQSSGNEVTPLDLLSCDIFVFQVCDPTHMLLTPSRMYEKPLPILCLYLVNALMWK